MNIEPAPRLPKIPFLVGDIVLVLTAITIGALSPRPLGSDTVIIIAVLIVLGIALYLTPILAAYAADTAEAVEHERQRLNDQAVRLNATIENLARATAHIKAVEEAVHKSAREAETLPYRMQEKLAEFNEALAAREESDREAMETELEQLRATHNDQLKSTAEKLGKAATDWSALEVATRKQLAAAEAALAKLQAQAAELATKIEHSAHAPLAKFDSQVATTLRELDARLAELKSVAATIPTQVTLTTLTAPESVPDLAVTPTPALESPLSPEPANAVLPTPESSPPTPEDAKPRKPRAPRKPKLEIEEVPAATVEPPAEGEPPFTPPPVAEPPPVPAEPIAPIAEAPSAPEPEPIAEPAPDPAEPFALSSDESPEPATPSTVESSASSDGATRLLATAYIGIGNKLFIRGDGPGLSWDHGVPMQFVSIGKWGWSTQEAAGPIRCKLYKNDQVPALPGEIVLESGRHTEVTALF